MSVLTTADRRAMPQSEFALPGGRYPVNDEAHARDALARAAQQRNAGNLSPADYATVVQRAHALLPHRNVRGM